MKSRFHLQFRTAVAIVAGILLLIESTNSNFLKPALDSRAPLAHLFVAGLGIAFLIQAAILAKQLASSSPR